MRSALAILITAGMLLVNASAFADPTVPTIKEVCATLPANAQLEVCLNSAGAAATTQANARHAFEAELKRSNGEHKHQLEELDRYDKALPSALAAIAARGKGAGDAVVFKLDTHHDFTILRGTKPVTVGNLREDYTAGANLSGYSAIWIQQLLQSNGVKVTVEKRYRKEHSIHSWWYVEYWALVASWS